MKKLNYLIIALFCLLTMGLAIVLSPERGEFPKIRQIDASKVKDLLPPEPFFHPPEPSPIGDGFPEEKEGAPPLHAGKEEEAPPSQPQVKPFPGQEEIVLDPYIQSIAEVSCGAELGPWKYIVLHHSGTSRGCAEAFDKNRERSTQGEAYRYYHFVIGNGTLSGSGEVEAGKAWKEQKPAFHCPNNLAVNDESIGVCLVGNFEKTQPEKTQIESLGRLLKFLVSKWKIKKSNILLRKEVPGEKTLSPGNFFPHLASLLEDQGI